MSFENQTTPNNRQPNLLISDCEQQLEDFVGELAVQN